MREKFKGTLEEKVWKIVEQENKQIEQNLLEIREAIENGELITSTNPFVELLFEKTKENVRSNMTEMEMYENCIEIRNRVARFEAENLMVRLDIKKQYHLKNTQELGDMFIKICFWDEEEPLYLFIRRETCVRIMFCVSGLENKAFLLFIDEEKKTRCLRIKEFYLLSVVKEDKGQWGILTSYSWFSGHLNTNTIQAINLIPVVDLLLADWFRQMVVVEEKEVLKDGCN